ncbi:SAM domain-containing protein SAMSN-1-like isoform X2 [Hemitrygon akajei]
MLVRGRKSHNAEDTKKIASHAASQDLEDRTPVGSLQQPQSKFQPKNICSENRCNQNELDPGWDFSYPWPSRAHTLGWYQMPDVLSPWDLKQHTCWRKLQDSVGPRWSATLPRERVWPPLCCPHACHCQAFPSSFTDTDLSDPLRSSSFGSFDRFRHHGHSAKLEDKAEDNVHDSEASGENPTKSGQNGSGLGKTMRAISKTMKKKMARKYIKALSEEATEDNAEDHPEHEAEGSSLRQCESMESLQSLNSGQAPAGGLAGASDGTRNRDSFRVDEEVPYTGPFCGRARVHTDFTPSPYDTDSLKLKTGDIIKIINKSTMGTWTGMLDGRLGNFKFIYVDVLPNEEDTAKKFRPHRRSTQPVPDSLQELLEGIQLKDLYSTFLLNGYQSLEDLKDLKESHLIELNITDAELRSKILTAAQQNYDVLSEEEDQNDPTTESQQSNLKNEQSQQKDCPRDSGCYATSEISDNGKEDLEMEHVPEMIEDVSLDN